ncbi:hypothetical protein DVH05_002049 [Phytophthora capsici]|nr:hypothetical protein DVH05_002049 [Phytophthora capsici]
MHTELPIHPVPVQTTIASSLHASLGAEAETARGRQQPRCCTATLQDPGYLSARLCLPPDIDAEESHVRDQRAPKRPTTCVPTLTQSPSGSDDEAAPSGGLGFTATKSPLRRASRDSERLPCV